MKAKALLYSGVVLMCGPLLIIGFELWQYDAAWRQNHPWVPAAGIPGVLIGVVLMALAYNLPRPRT